MSKGRKICRGFLPLIISMLFISIIGGLSGEANKNLGNTIYVDDDNTSGPWDGTIELPYMYIQDAIDNASSGDTIFVFNGTYYENIVINLPINLVGESKNNTIIDGDREGTVVSIYSPINLHGFTIQNSGTDANDSGISVEITKGSVNISDNIISHNNGAAGLYIIGGNNHIISNNIITLNKNFGLFIGCIDNSIICNNVISNNSLMGSIIIGSDRIQIYNNNASRNNLTGMILFACNDCTISSNNFYSNFPFGVMIGNNCGAHNVVTKNNFLYNTANFAVFLNTARGELKLFLTSQIPSNELLWSFLDDYICNITVKPASRGFFSGCTWNENYWYDNPGFLPEPIYGLVFLSKNFFIPWLNFDWHPAKEPYEI